MLSDEERKAINQLKADTSFYDYELKNGNYIYELFKIEVYKKDVDVILNLIKKQSKEIEELKEKNKSYDTAYKLGKAYSNKKWKDKIKAKIEEYKKDGKIINQTMPYCGEYKNHFEIKALQSLLEKE